ncbi:hypothetical protein [Flavobacterium sp.]|uniref:hypothetical protein n=1 Tax=Flavobacterium sp. TaxID=239 RepID=UPI0040333AE6
MKNLVLFLFCLQATLTFSQTSKFNNDHFKLVQDIFHKTTPKDLNSFMEKNGFTTDGVEKDEDGSMHYFKADFSRVEVYYTTTNKIIGVNDTYVGAVNNTFIEGKIRDAGYSSTDVTTDLGDVEIVSKQWAKAGTNMIFLTSVDEELGGGTLMYGAVIE